MQRLRTFIFRLHLWLGLSAGALFVLLGLTGTVLVFYQEVDAVLHPEIRVRSTQPAPGWDSPLWDVALATVRTRWPERTGPWRFEATGEPGAIPVRYQPPGQGHHGRRVMVWLTPDGTQVLREDEWGGYLVTWLYNLHMNLLLDAQGRAFVGWAGLVIVLLLATGLWAWWPRGNWRKALRFKPDAVPTRRLRDIHKLIALAALPLLLMLVATGVMLSLPEESNAVLASTVGPVQRVAPPRSSVGQGNAISISQALTVARRALPLARLAWVEAPGPGNGAFMVRVQQPGDPSYRFPHSYVYVDQYSGQVIGVQDRDRFGAANAINNWLHPLHDASIGGVWFRGLIALCGLVPLALYVTGMVRWQLVRRARTRARSVQRHVL